MAEIKPGDTPYVMPEAPAYDSVIRALKNSDPANATEVFNPLFQQIINNVHAVKLSDDQKAKADLSNVSEESFQSMVEHSGVIGPEGQAAAKDLSNVSKEDFKAFADSVGITGPEGNVAAKDLSNVSKEDFEAFADSVGITGPEGNVAAKDLSNVPNEAFSEKAAASGVLDSMSEALKPVVTDITLLKTGWAGSTVPYTQQISVEGVTVESLLLISPVTERAVTEAVGDSGIMPTAQAQGSITFSAYEKKPEIDLRFYVVNWGVA